MRKSYIFSKNFILLFLFSCAICIGMNTLNVIMPLYVTETLGSTTAVAGLMTTVYTLFACISRPINGMLTDRIGRKPIMTAGAALFGFACFVPSVWAALALLAVCRIMMGIGYSAATTACNTASTDIIPEDRIAEGIGYFGMSQSLASAIGPAIAAIAIAAVGNQKALFGNTIIAAIAIVLALVVSYRRPEATKAEKTNVRFSPFEKTAILPSLFQGLSLFLITCLMCFMTLYLVSVGFDAGTAGTFFFVASILIVAIRIGCSGLMRRLPTTCFLLAGYVCLILACLLLRHVRTLPMVICTAVLYGAAHGTIWMVLGSDAVRLAPADKRGAANATFYFAFDAAIGLGAAFWGWLIDRTSFVNCFTLVAICAAILAIISIPAFHKRNQLH